MMKRILIVTQQAEKFSKLATGLSAENICDVIYATSVADARSAAFGLMDLIIIDENLDERSGLSIAKDMIRINALAQIALVSELSPEAFHEAAEGLGILAKLPPYPDENDAGRSLNALSVFS
jgi:DNA-binding response OmpR family regulator